jgi:high-affinity K+ transport system ATPase subunit B
LARLRPGNPEGGQKNAWPDRSGPAVFVVMVMIVMMVIVIVVMVMVVIMRVFVVAVSSVTAVVVMVVAAMPGDIHGLQSCLSSFLLTPEKCRR